MNSANIIVEGSQFLKKLRSDEGQTLETSALESLYGGQFTLSYQLLIYQTFVIVEALLYRL